MSCVFVVCRVVMGAAYGFVLSRRVNGLGEQVLCAEAKGDRCMREVTIRSTSALAGSGRARKGRICWIRG